MTKFKANPHIRVHIHHASREDGPDTKHECLGYTDLKPGDAFGGELAGGFFYVGMCQDGDHIVTFVNTCYPEDLQLGEIAGTSKGVNDEH